nr:cathepsin L-like proteinase [Leptinotarsa decemlineata]
MGHSFSLLFSIQRKIRMKLFAILASLVVAITAASDQELWVEFKNTHGKSYRSLREEKLRFNIFQEKLREIESHNVKYENGEESYFLAVNQFSDLTKEEFISLLNENIATKPEISFTPLQEALNESLEAPTAINWVHQGAVLGVKNQGQCGSCWAFSTTGSLEGQSIIKHGRRVSLSEQQLVDCSTSNNACQGGSMEYAFNYVANYGLETEASYPYRGVRGSCRADSSRSAIRVRGYASVGRNEQALKNAVGTVGPISVAVEASIWQSYGGGIFNHPECTGYYLNHGVLAVGYGNEDGEDYWLIKNSWGTNWGEGGYIRLIRNRNNQCGVASDGSYPLLY